MKILVALGGNAILKPKQKGTEQEQLGNLYATSEQLARLVEEGHRISITHGNGPQVGDIMLLYELAKSALPQMPMDVCGAQSQGMIGYLLQQSMINALRGKCLNPLVATVITQTVVDRKDSAFANPMKPVGPFYSKEEAEALMKKNGWQVKQDSNRGYRRMVASPEPLEVIEAPVIKQLFDQGFIVISSGGGGIPVIRQDNGSLQGIEAVIDKDLTASLIASILDVDLFLILTDVESVYLNYGTKNQVPLSKLTTEECSMYQREGQFSTGSMAPKIEAARRFVSLSGKKAIITSLERALFALTGKTGTLISNG